jgi:polyhydroxyalkanoate synthesis regulator phasin
VTQQGMFEKLKARGEEVWNRVSNDLMQNPQFIRALQGALKGKELIDQAVARALKTMNVPNRSEFKRALQRIEQLEQEVATLKAAPPRTSRPRTSSNKSSGSRSRAKSSKSSGSESA